MSDLISDDNDEQPATLQSGEGIYQDSRGQRHNKMPELSDSTELAKIDGACEKEVEVDISAGQKMLSAVSGSLLTSLLVTPLDVVRVRLQSQPTSSLLFPRALSGSSAFANLPSNLGVTACCREVFWVNNISSVCMVADASTINAKDLAADCAADETRRKTFNSTLDGLRKIARHEGIRSLWRGLSPTLVMSIPGNVIYFTGYDTLRSNPGSPIKTYIPDAYAPLIAGSMARIAAASVISPIEMFRTRMQAATSGHTGKRVFTETLRGLRKMVHIQGYTSLWRGLTLTLWRDVPFSGFYWWGYETLRDALTNLREPTNVPNQPRSRSRSSENHTTTFFNSFLAGATSGAVAAFVTTPFDVGKTRQQVLQHSSKSKIGQKGTTGLRPEELSMPRFLYRIWADEGIAGLFRGWTPRCLRVAPACAIMISSYEIGKKMARAINEKSEGASQG